MSKVRLVYRGEGLYSVLYEKNWGDNYGDYYPAPDVEQLVEAAKRALPYCDASYQTIELRAALEPFKEIK